MSWWYFLLNCTMLAVAGSLGWRSRRLRTRHFAACVGAAAALLGFRTFLHAHPEHEQRLLVLSDDYLYFAAWDAPLAALMVFGLAGRLHSRRPRRLVFVSLGLLALLCLWNSLALCVQPDYAMEARFGPGGICRQRTSYSCGPAACVTMLKLAGEEVSEGEMARLCLLRPGKGATVLELCRGLNIVLRQKDQRAVIQRIRPDQLDGLPPPFLAVIRRSESAEHCVVVLEVRPDAVLLGDPAQGRFACAREDFLNDWTGMAITVKPSSLSTVPAARSKG